MTARTLFADNSAMPSNGTPLRMKNATTGEVEGYTPAGAGSVVDSDVAYLDAAGSDATGNGTMAAPWRTAQKAVNEGYRVLRGGVGSFGDITLTSTSAIFLQLLGVGDRGRTTFGNINLTCSEAHIGGNGQHMVTAGDILIKPAPAANGADGVGVTEGGAPGNAGEPATNSTVRGLRCGSIELRSGDGGHGGTGGPGDSESGGGQGGDGGQAGGAATLEIIDCDYTGALSGGGTGGNGGNGGADFGGGLGIGGNGANGVTGGALVIRRSREASGHQTPAGFPGSGGSGRDAGMEGALGSHGTTNVTEFSSVGFGSDTTETVSASMVDGSFIASS
jgi:hypothetical protein